MFRSILQITLLLVLIPFCLNSFSQIIIQSGPDVTPVDMVEFLLDDGMMYDNVTFQGADISRGIFMDGDTTILGFGSGIFLCSGSRDNIPGPNNSSSMGTNNGTPGDATLNSLTTSTTYDAAVLEFDLLADFDTLAFRYVFGSEEYNEWVGSTFNDVFGLFISGPDPDGGYYTDKNIAFVPETVNTVVSINNVNNGYALPGAVPTGPCTNCDYFIDNTGGLTLQYDAFTVALTAWIPVVPCEEYHLKIGVADVGDGIFDSGIFLEMKSLEQEKVGYTVALDPPGLEEDLYEGVVGAKISFRLPPGTETPYTLFLDLDGTANPQAYPEGDFVDEVPTTIEFEEGSDTASILIIPAIDGLIEGDEILQIIVQDNLGCPNYPYNAQDTIELLITDYTEMSLSTIPNQLICEGMEVDLSAQVEHGYPPYSFFWEPGGYTTDTITVSPDTTTMYYIYVSDVLDTVSDSILVTVFPNHGGFLSYAFEKANNPQLPFTITGEILEDSVPLAVPPGPNLQGLVATFTLYEGAIFAVANNQFQYSGVTPNDFTNPVNYQVFAPGGCFKDWTVAVTMATGIGDQDQERISVTPNPASDNLSVHNATGSEIQLINGKGIEILLTEITRSPCELDVRHLPDGIYYLKIKRHNKETTHKIILAR